jgi:hypothetical protein
VPGTVDPALVEQRILEAAQRLPPEGAVSGWAALRLAGGGFFDGRAPDGKALMAVRLVVPRPRNLRQADLINVGRERLEPDEVAIVHGVPCTVPLRATFDEARRSPDLREAVVAVDMALAAGLFSLAEYVAYANDRRKWPGARRARAAGRLADPRSLSPGETRMRLIWVLDAGLAAPRCNWPIADLDGNRLGKPDLLGDELGVVGEFNGAEHRTRARQALDIRREDAFRGVGLEYFAVVGSDQFDIPLVLSRIRATSERARTSRRTRGWLIARDPGPP